MEPSPSAIMNAVAAGADDRYGQDPRRDVLER
jgi:hypothetical protein